MRRHLIALSTILLANACNIQPQKFDAEKWRGAERLFAAV
jgi:hypothetical protein